LVYVSRISPLCRCLLLALLGTCNISFCYDSPSEASDDSSRAKAAMHTAAADPSQKSLDWLDISFSTRLRYEAVDNRFKLGEDPEDQQLPLRTRIGVEIKEVTHPLHFMFEFEDSRVYLTNSRSTVNLTMRNEHDILQAYAAVDFSRNRNSRLNSILYIGRQSFNLGNRRLFARNNYRNTTNRFDGLRFSISVPQKWNLDTFFFLPVLIYMDEMDRRLKNSYLWGGYFTLFPSFGGSGEIYYLGFDADPAPGAILKRRYSTIGGRLNRDSKPGKFGYEVESAWQFGKIGELDHFAHLQHLQLAYTFRAPWEPSVTGAFDYASGDCDPYDHNSGNFDPMFGARRWEYGPTGILNWMYRSNINSPALFVMFKPTGKLQILPMLRWLWLAQARAPWVGMGLHDVTGMSGTSIGKTLEIRARYNFARYLRHEIGYVRFFKGTYPSRVPGSPTGEDTNYFFAELELSFADLYSK
jgi:hypothetical protein